MGPRCHAHIGDQIAVTVMDIMGSEVLIGIVAPPEVPGPKDREPNPPITLH